METVCVYFDESGNAGPVGTVVDWAAFGAWADQLEGGYPEILHLWEQGWELKLDRLAEQLARGLEKEAPDNGRARRTAEELLDLVSSRAEDDSALALGWRMDNAA